MDLIEQVTPADLRSLELDDESRVDVRCRICDRGIVYEEDPVDPLQSLFYCGGRAAHWMKCFFRATKFDVMHATPAMLNLWFYVLLPVPDEVIWKMDVEYHVGRTAFHYLRQATPEEVFVEARKTLWRLRQEAAQK